MKKFATLIVFGLLMVAHGEADAQSLCGGKVKAVRRGSLPEEVSGSSSLFWMDGRLWTANDHGALRLYALDTLTAEIDSVIDLGAKVYDLEEVTLDSLYLYFGDFGDNNGTRSSLRILRLSRRDLAEGRFIFDTIFFHYPERTVDNARDFDCEAFLAGTDSLYLFTKQWTSHGSVCYSLPKVPGTYAACRRFELPTDGLVTAACYLPDKRRIVLLGYSMIAKPFLFVIDGFSGEDIATGLQRRVSTFNPLGTQTEGIASLDGQHFFLTNETLSLRLFFRSAALLHLELLLFQEEPTED